MSTLRTSVISLAFLLFSQQAFSSEWEYTFRPGDTLWDLCAKYIAAPDCWQKIAKRNNVDEPKQIKPGTRLFLPIAWLKTKPVSAKVLSARGQSTLIKSNGDESELDEGMAIAVGDKVITQQGTVTLQFADESILIVTPDSEVSFDTMSLFGDSGMVDTRVRLNRGRAKAKVKSMKSRGSRYEILTPAAVAAVRGTEFRVVSEDTNPPQMRTEVLEGNVAVANDAGEQLLPAGYALKAVSGEKPPEPIKLLAAPEFDSELLESVSLFPLKISWLAVDGAEKYRVQLFESGLFFDDLIQEQETEDHRFEIALLEEGDYKVIVRAIDADGFEGMESSYRMAVAEPEVVQEPASDDEPLWMKLLVGSIFLFVLL